MTQPALQISLHDRKKHEVDFAGYARGVVIVDHETGQWVAEFPEVKTVDDLPLVVSHCRVWAADRPFGGRVPLTKPVAFLAGQKPRVVLTEAWTFEVLTERGE